MFNAASIDAENRARRRWIRGRKEMKRKREREKSGKMRGEHGGIGGRLVGNRFESLVLNEVEWERSDLVQFPLSKCRERLPGEEKGAMETARRTKRQNSPSPSAPVPRSAGGRGGRSCLQARTTGVDGGKSTRRLLAVKTSQVFRGYQLFSRALPKMNARGSFSIAFSAAMVESRRTR